MLYSLAMKDVFPRKLKEHSIKVKPLYNLLFVLQKILFSFHMLYKSERNSRSLC